jgi:hypothetical protein
MCATQPKECARSSAVRKHRDQHWKLGRRHCHVSRVLNHGRLEFFQKLMSKSPSFSDRLCDRRFNFSEFLALVGTSKFMSIFLFLEVFGASIISNSSGQQPHSTDHTFMGVVTITPCIIETTTLRALFDRNSLHAHTADPTTTQAQRLRSGSN